MADANALAAAIEAEMAARSAGSGADEPHIVINDDRSITVPEELLALGVQYDRNVETVTIDCPRYWDGHDLSEMLLFVNFVHYEPSNTSIQYSVDIDQLTLASMDEERMLLEWTINASAMRYDGTLAWLVCAKTIDNAGNELLHWNSQICYDTKVHKGLEYNGESGPEPDYVAQALAQILAAQQAVRQDTVIASKSAEVAKEAQDKIEALEQIVVDVDATAAEQQTQVAAAIKACEDAVSNVQLVTEPFYIVDMDQNKTYHAAIQVRGSKPVIVYDELVPPERPEEPDTPDQEEEDSP